MQKQLPTSRKAPIETIDPIESQSSRRRDPIRWLIGSALLLIAAIAIGTAVMIFNFRDRAIKNGERELENAARLLASHFDQELEDFVVVQNAMAAKVQDIDSPDDFKQQMSTREMHLLLRAKLEGATDATGVNVYDADGRLVNTSEIFPAPPISVADRKYFGVLKSSPSESLGVELLRSRVTGQMAILIARKMTGAKGEFLGVATRGFSPDKIRRHLSQMSLGKDASISMFRRDGTLLARYPGDNGMAGRKFEWASTTRKVLFKEKSAKLSPIDGKLRLISVGFLTNLPIAVMATTTVESALADWREQTWLLVVAAGTSTLLIVVVVLLVIRRMTLQNREAQGRLELQKHRLDTALNNMAQGLVLYDASARIVVCNQRYVDMYGLSNDVIKPGCHFSDVIRHRKETGTFKGDVDEFCSTVLGNVAQGKITHSVLESGDGRSIRIVNQPLPDGGWVATMEDITERLRLEQERDRNHAFLHQIIDHIPSQITVKDVRDSRYVLVNRIAEAEFGMPREAVVGKTTFDLFPRASADIIVADDKKALLNPDGLFLNEHLWDNQLRDGKRYITSKRVGIRDQAGAIQYLINVVDDVTERRLSEEKIAHLAHFDSLTDLPNRALFRQQIEREFLGASRGERFALFYIDVDEFKGINDSLGHHVGDELLKCVAERIKGCIREVDLVARLGGDEFAVIRKDVTCADDVVWFAKRLQEAIRHPYQCLGHQLSADASIGIALAPQDGGDLDQLIKNADLAMYAAKADGRRTYRFFEPAMDARAKERLILEQDLRQALMDGNFEVQYQPLVNLRSNQITGCEALLRWRHPERGMVSPAEFIPVAEDTGLINQLGEWVLATACAEAANWPNHVRIAVNVSPVQFRSPTFGLKVAAALSASGVLPNRLELEITEAVLIRDDETALGILHQLRALGVRIALDDFGTGYSSLSYLQRFPFDKIKIDRCFVNNIVETGGSVSIVQAVVNIAAARNMTTTAEGVETEQQREVLLSLGCTEMQGYLFSAAKPACEVARFFDAELGTVPGNVRSLPPRALPTVA